MSAMVFLPPTSCRDDEQRAPFAQVRLAVSVLGTRGHALVAKRWLLQAIRDTAVKESEMQKDILSRTTFTASSSFNTYP
jgi:hypothetical protein